MKFFPYALSQPVEWLVALSSWSCCAILCFRLTERLTKPASCRGPCPTASFTGHQEFFKEFLRIANNPFLNTHVSDVLAAHILEVCCDSNFRETAVLGVLVHFSFVFYFFDICLVKFSDNSLKMFIEFVGLCSTAMQWVFCLRNAYWILIYMNLMIIVMIALKGTT